MSYPWTPRMARNLKWLMGYRDMSKMELGLKMGYDTRQPIDRLLCDWKEPYRPRRVEALGPALGLPFAERHHWAAREEDFRAWVLAQDTEEHWRSLARREAAAKAPPVPRWRRVLGWLTAARPERKAK